MKEITVSIRSLTRVQECVDYLLNCSHEQMGLVWGEPGTGKTQALRQIACRLGAVYFPCFPSMSKFFLVSRLCRAAGLKSPGSIAEGIDNLVESVVELRRIILIDEADFLRRELLDLLRVIHDQAQTPVIFAGMSRLYERVADFSLFADRCQYFVEVLPCDFLDTRRLIEGVAEIPFAEDLVSRIHQESQGFPRRVWRITNYIENWALDQGLTEISAATWGIHRLLLPEGTSVPGKVVRLRGGK